MVFYLCAGVLLLSWTRGLTGRAGGHADTGQFCSRCSLHEEEDGPLHVNFRATMPTSNGQAGGAHTTRAQDWHSLPPVGHAAKSCLTTWCHADAAHNPVTAIESVLNNAAKAAEAIQQQVLQPGTRPLYASRPYYGSQTRLVTLECLSLSA